MKLVKLGTFLGGIPLVSTLGMLVSCGEPGEKPYVDEDPEVFTGNDFFHRMTNNIKPVIPEGVTTLKKYSMRQWKWDLDFPIPSSVKIIEDNVFEEAIIKPGFKLPDSIEKMGIHVFKKAKFYTDIDWPSKLETVPGYTFSLADFSALDELDDQQSHKGINWPENSSTNVKIIGKYSLFMTKIPYNFQLPTTLETVKEGGVKAIQIPWLVEYSTGYSNADKIHEESNDPNYKAPLDWPSGPDLNNDGFPDGVLFEDNSNPYYDMGKVVRVQPENYLYNEGDPKPFYRRANWIK